LSLKCDILGSESAFKCNLYRYNAAATETTIHASIPVDLAVRLFSHVVLNGGLYSGADADIRWSELKTRHLRRLHAVFVSEDLDVIMHVHPEDSDDAGRDTSAAETSREFYLRNLTFPRAGKYAMLMTYEVGVAGIQQGDCDATGLARDTPGATEEVQVVRYLNVTGGGEFSTNGGGGSSGGGGGGGGSGGGGGGASSGGGGSGRGGGGGGPSLTPAATAVARAVAFRRGGPGAVQRQPDAVSLSHARRACACGEGGGQGGGRRLHHVLEAPALQQQQQGGGEGGRGGVGSAAAAYGSTGGEGGVCYSVAFGLAGEPPPPPSSSGAGAGAGAEAGTGYGTVVSAAGGGGGGGGGAIVTERRPQRPPPPPDGGGEGEGGGDSSSSAACVGLTLTVSTANLAAATWLDPHADYPLMPYLGAGAHLTLVSADLSFVSHGHAVPVPLRGVSGSKARQLAAARCGAARAMAPGASGGAVQVEFSLPGA
jgi:hypothetical protein